MNYLQMSILCLVAVVFIAITAFADGEGDSEQKNIQRPSADWNNPHFRKATFAAGCFWGVEELFRKTSGVIDTKVGYTGGYTEKPTYRQVCSGDTGHAEAVHILYNPEKVGYKDLLKLFWENHNPTTLNRQGPDIGNQYRSAIFYHNDEQKALAFESKKELEESGIYTKPVVTEILPAREFYPAEEYHQRYLQKKGLKICH